jgi:hypothetical protein
VTLVWRYLVDPDGSFSRVANINGALDAVSDEELARPHPDRRDEEPARSCSRCGTELLLYWHGPLMTGVWMELCPACDAHCPAARAFIRWYRDPNRGADQLPKLFEDWETETMRAHGWVRGPQPEASVGPQPLPGLTPRGRG